jgi:hypothetical protein
MGILPRARGDDLDAMPVKIPAILPGGYTKALDSLGCEALLAKSRPDDRDDRQSMKSSTPYDEQMDSTPFGDATPAAMAGLAAPQDIEIDRGQRRVRADGGG